jgi:hypothetical protein
MTLVSMKASGPLIERSTWLSAAKWTIVRDGVLGKELFDQIGIADIALDQLDAFKARDIGRVARISERIEHGDGVVGVMFAPVMHEVGADESGAAGDEQFSHVRGFP